ncbi:MAG: ParB/RepB/Spo0J family partition protein [Planctomycetes bacterium]|nr:ParB/RepB/Spo0J family partition protein [Planctomycetota bacterium]
MGKSSSDTPAAQRPRRLGRGLASLMANTKLDADPADAAPPVPAAPSGRYEPVAPPPAPSPADGAPLMVPIDAIRPNPYQPRRAFDQEALAELADSIRQQGLLQPLLVVKDGDDWVLVAGERRLRASKVAGLAEVPCIRREASREQMLQWALTENIQRSDLNIIDRAVAFRDYMDRFGLTQAELAAQLSLPRSTVANCLRLLDLCDDVQRSLADGLLSFGHGKILAGLAGREADQKRLARLAVESGLSVRHLEQLVAQAINRAPGAPAAAPPPRTAKSDYILDVERQLARVVGSKVTIRPKGKRPAGRIVLEYNSLDDFDRILDLLGIRLES